MRTSFELKILATDIVEAKNIAITSFSTFLGIPAESVEDQVQMELKISYPKAETVTEIEDTLASGIFQVVVFGSVNQSASKPFGL